MCSFHLCFARKWNILIFQTFLKILWFQSKAENCDNRKPNFELGSGVQILFLHPVETWFCIRLRLAKVKKKLNTYLNNFKHENAKITILLFPQIKRKLSDDWSLFCFMDFLRKKAKIRINSYVLQIIVCINLWCMYTIQMALYIAFNCIISNEYIRYIHI